MSLAKMMSNQGMAPRPRLGPNSGIIKLRIPSSGMIKLSVPSRPAGPKFSKSSNPAENFQHTPIAQQPCAHEAMDLAELRREESPGLNLSSIPDLPRVLKLTYINRPGGPKISYLKLGPKSSPVHRSTSTSLDVSGIPAVRQGAPSPSQPNLARRSPSFRRSTSTSTDFSDILPSRPATVDAKATELMDELRAKNPNPNLKDLLNHIHPYSSHPDAESPSPEESAIPAVRPMVPAVRPMIPPYGGLRPFIYKETPTKPSHHTQLKIAHQNRSKTSTPSQRGPAQNIAHNNRQVTADPQSSGISNIPAVRPAPARSIITHNNRPRRTSRVPRKAEKFDNSPL